MFFDSQKLKQKSVTEINFALNSRKNDYHNSLPRRAFDEHETLIMRSCQAYIRRCQIFFTTPSITSAAVSDMLVFWLKI